MQTSQLELSPGQRPLQLTPAADVYSLAKTAYTLICGASPRAFAHEAITELPSPIASQPWGGSLLRVLERATQTRAADRYQTVQAFWEDLNDVAMPVTQPLALATARRQVTSDLNVDEVLTAAAPPRPKFETSRELKQQQVETNGSVRPKIVVPIAGRQSLPNARVFPVAQAPGRMTVPVQSPISPAPGPAVVAVKPRNRRRDFVVGLVLVLCFAGLLAATGAYVRKWIKLRTAPQTTTTTPTGDIGRQAVTKTDVNLRAGPNGQTEIVGLAEFGSKIQVISINPNNNNWCQVQIIQHSRPKKDPNSSDIGWLNRSFLDFD
jgi:hypothetical protein